MMIMRYSYKDYINKDIENLNNYLNSNEFIFTLFRKIDAYTALRSNNIPGTL